ncbi:MAG: group 1 truncated hemoglobin [Kofleriaceae bacterium]|nr:group 1 truncated hemoglobin [Kofleriaceae bacterium]
MRSLLFAFALAAAACGSKQPRTPTAAPPPTTPLYDRLGRLDAIKAIVKDFVEERVAKDPRIRARFATVDVAHLEQMLTEQICEATGGPCKYTGKSMKDAHAGMAITEAEWRAFVEDLVASMIRFDVPKAEQDELIGKLATMHDDIVGK